MVGRNITQESQYRNHGHGERSIAETWVNNVGLRVDPDEDHIYFELVHPDATVPSRAHPTDAGLDLFSVENVGIEPHGKAIVDTGIKMAMNDRAYARIASRSGMSARHSVEVGAGVIDSSYRNVIKVILYNHHFDHTYTVKKGDRIAQMIITKIEFPTICVVDNIGNETSRGENGFGSSGR